MGLTQQEAADATKVSKRTYVGYEAGDRAPDATALLNASRAGADIVHVLTGRSLEENALEYVDWDELARALDSVRAALGEKDATLSSRERLNLARMLLARRAA